MSKDQFFRPRVTSFRGESGVPRPEVEAAPGRKLSQQEARRKLDEYEPHLRELYSFCCENGIPCLMTFDLGNEKQPNGHEHSLHITCVYSHPDSSMPMEWARRVMMEGHEAVPSEMASFLNVVASFDEDEIERVLKLVAEIEEEREARGETSGGCGNPECKTHGGHRGTVH